MYILLYWLYNVTQRPWIERSMNGLCVNIRINIVWTLPKVPKHLLAWDLLWHFIRISGGLMTGGGGAAERWLPPPTTLPPAVTISRDVTDIDCWHRVLSWLASRRLIVHCFKTSAPLPGHCFSLYMSRCIYLTDKNYFIKY